MKKYHIIIILLFSFNLIIAQGVGLKGGINLGKLVGDDVDMISEGLDETYQIGYAGGLFFAMPVDPFGIRVEALYSQNGAKYEGSEDGIEGSYSIILNWINVPILFELRTGPVRFFAGPYLDFFLSGKMKFEWSYGGESFDGEEDIESEDISTFNYGFVGGAAIAVMNGLELEIRYSQGLNSLDKEPEGFDDSNGAYKEADYKPSMIQAMLNFGLTSK